MRRLDAWIHDSFETSSEGLALYRILFAVFALVVISPGHQPYVDLVPLAALPDSWFTPPAGPMMLFGGFPSEATSRIIHLLLNVSLAALLVGFRTRFASVATGVLFLVIFGFSNSLGKINHTILFALLPLIMVPSGWGSAYSYDSMGGARKEHASWPLPLLAIVISFAMFTAGFAKILGGWLDPGTHAAYGHLVKQFFVRGRTDLLADYAIGLQSEVLWEIADYATVFFEVGFLFALLSPRTIRLFAGLAVLFHFNIMLTLNIAFVYNIIVYAAFIDWKAVAGWIDPHLPPVPAGAAVRLATAGGLLVVGAGAHLFGSPLLLLNDSAGLTSDLIAHEAVVLTLAVVVVILIGIRRIVLQLERVGSRSRTT